MTTPEKRPSLADEQMPSVTDLAAFRAEQYRPMTEQEEYEMWRDDRVESHGVKAAFFAGLHIGSRRVAESPEIAAALRIAAVVQTPTLGQRHDVGMTADAAGRKDDATTWPSMGKAACAEIIRLAEKPR